ncbi:L-aspartate oxidase [Texcoconibacillus texcoconensis]|uniref:L-aspartate oxidase n=1 Tax=Texcoconibacillus texcoconensis TaxID=1095777 RepID=A0A840QSL9_9BACI|nr:L-aspartate oxidase [Texcoconibacillus texcoconensis]
MSKRPIVIIGTGISALAIINFISKEQPLIIISKSDRGNSWLAQGGVAGAFGKRDSVSSHVKDTMNAGCHHGDIQAITMLAEEGVSSIQSLIDEGMIFDCDNQGELLLGREGAHSSRRILHAGGDQTGKKIMSFLTKRVSSNVTRRSDETLIDVRIENGACTGVFTKDRDGRVKTYEAEAVVFATGGCGGLFPYTSNSEGITGDGFAVAYRAGAALSDMEFLQFHPTMCVHEDQSVGLLSEAVRGEGATVINQDGDSVMDGVHPLGDLAPRDIVARTIYERMMQGEELYLDARNVQQFAERFPSIEDMRRRESLSLGMLPIRPAAHFMMGGVKTDLYGRTTVPGLYAVGEVARTGVHGANRLASNSLLEALVFARRTAHALMNDPKTSRVAITPKTVHPTFCSEKLPTRSELREMVEKHIGIIRDRKSLRSFVDWLKPVAEAYIHLEDRSGLSLDQLERSNMAIVSYLIACSAYERKESRGAHYRSDFPKSSRSWEQVEITQSMKQAAML